MELLAVAEHEGATHCKIATALVLPHTYIDIAITCKGKHIMHGVIGFAVGGAIDVVKAAVVEEATVIITKLGGVLRHVEHRLLGKHLTIECYKPNLHAHIGKNHHARTAIRYLKASYARLITKCTGRKLT